MDIEQVLLKAKKALEETQDQGYNLPGSLITSALNDINECLGKLEYIANSNDCDDTPFWERNTFDEKFHQELMDNTTFRFSDEQARKIEKAFEEALSKIKRED